MSSKYSVFSPTPDGLGPDRAEASMRVHVAYGVQLGGDSVGDAESRPQQIEIFTGGPDRLPALTVRSSGPTRLERSLTFETNGPCTLDTRDALKVLWLVRDMLD